MRGILIIISFFCGLFLACGHVFADTIVLDDGTSFEGTVVEKTAEHVVITKGSATVRYPPDTILLIKSANGETKTIAPSAQPQNEIREFKDDFVGDLAKKVYSGDINAAKQELAQVQEKPNDPVSTRAQIIIADADSGKISHDDAFVLLQGVSYQLQGDASSAIEAYYNALRNNPAYGQVYALLGEAFKSMGQAGVAAFYQSKFAAMFPVS